MPSNFPGSVDVFKTIPNPTVTATSLSDASDDTLSTRLQQHSDSVLAVENYLITSGLSQNIWNVRLRSFNAVGNPNFEVSQRNCNTAVTNPNVAFIEDRWQGFTAGSMSYTAQVQTPTFAGITIPGTTYTISNTYLNITITAQDASLAATDRMSIFQAVEGPYTRELVNGVHSMSLLCRSSVAGLTYGMVLQDPSAAVYLSKLCTIPSANTWTLVTLPNMPAFPSGRSFSTVPGVQGYWLNITLAAGSSIIGSANDSWQTANKTGAFGQSNFFSNVVGSTFDLAFVQHEPSSTASQLIDKPFNMNIDECKRYYSKSYDYSKIAGTNDVTGPGVFDFVKGVGSYFVGGLRFPKEMAKHPAVTIWHPTGAINTLKTNTVDQAVTSVTGLGNNGFDQIHVTLSGTPTECYAHYTADSGW